MQAPHNERAPETAETVAFGIAGMSCAGCASRAEKALRALPGLEDARVDFATERAIVVPGMVPSGDIKAAVVNAGFTAEQTEIDLDIGGMTCAGCAANVEKALKAVPGVVSAEVNLAMERAHVVWLGKDVSGAALVDAVTAAGYRAEPRATDAELRRRQAAEQAEADARRLKHETLLVMISAALSTPLLAMMVLPPLGVAYHVPAWGQLLLCLPVQFWIGGRFYVGAYRSLKAGSGNMDVLVALGTSAAFALSTWIVFKEGLATTSHLYYEASAVVVTLVVFGKLIESRAKRGTTEAIRQLMALRPERARVERDGAVSEISVDAVRIDDLVIVRPGERIPVDGVVEAGTSQADESLITGESVPVAKQTGDPVTGGAINGSGELRIRVGRVGEDTTLAKIVRLVENAQSGKAPVQRLVDRVSAIFVPVVVGIAALAFAGWWAAGGGMEVAIINAVSVLVIACPCALGLATPTAIVAGTGAAARAGILIKDVAVLEQAYRVDTVAFDKTGTLTRGQPVLTDIEPLSGSADELLGIAASVQAGSEHPLARAVLEAAKVRGIGIKAASDTRAHVGAGVAAMVDGERVLIGNRAMMAESSVGIEDAEAALQRLEGEGKTVVMVAAAGKVIGVLAIRDEVRPEAAAAIRLLKTRGIDTVMLSGDAVRVAEAIGNGIGIGAIHAGLKPEDKVSALQNLSAQGRHTAMVGDGINDAPALAAADVGIAMGSGSDAAMETAGITLMRPDPRLVGGAMQIARATWYRIRWNLFWAFIFNIIGLPLAALGYLSPAIAGAAMAMSSITVVSSSLMLRGWRPEGMEQSYPENANERS
ncbi:heavy metal translocating P-type ATPase [Thalassospiraceae bacterium LMO-JJ14]|nr:heavy metal translocating P-type ATPase [Thalassospiraceae bacterium LMO-JJ14]